jgi:hypothetical protein
MTKFLPVRSLMNLISTCRSTSLKFMVTRSPGVGSSGRAVLSARPASDCACTAWGAPFCFLRVSSLPDISLRLSGSDFLGS